MAYLIVALVVAMILAAACLGASSVGALMLPQTVADAVTKLLPMSVMTDARADADGNIHVSVSVRGAKREVHVRRTAFATVAWSHEEAAVLPEKRTYSISEFQYDGMAVKSDTRDMEETFENAMDEVLSSKGLERVRDESSQMLITPLISIHEEQKTSIEELNKAFDSPEETGVWAPGIRMALLDRVSGDIPTTAKGALVLDIYDSSKGANLWRALAMAKISLDANQEQQNSRICDAIKEMLRKFPPGGASH